MGSVKALQMIGQFYDASAFDAGERMVAVKEGETPVCGRPYAPLCHGAYGALAGGHGDL